METDVFVIGGGPIGLATAIAVRRKGFSVIVADGCRPPIDKACGEGLMPGGVAAAALLGVPLPEIGSFPFKGIRFLDGAASVSAEFPDGSGYGVRRTVLHHALTAQAERCGVELRWGCSVPRLDAVQARWIVGADGTHSRVRSWAGLAACRRDTRRFGFRRHYRLAPWSDFVEIHWGNKCQIYVTPVAAGEVGVALLSQDPKLRLRDALRQFPALAARLGTVPESSVERGAVTASRRLRRVTSGNVALIGDASGSVDAVTGEGLSLGFQQALSLAFAIERGDLAHYELAHRRLSARPRFMAALMLSIDRFPWLRKRVPPALCANPDLFRRLLAMHVGAARPMDFAFNCVALGWQVLNV